MITFPAVCVGSLLGDSRCECLKCSQSRCQLRRAWRKHLIHPRLPFYRSVNGGSKLHSQDSNQVGLTLGLFFLQCDHSSELLVAN